MERGEAKWDALTSSRKVFWVGKKKVTLFNTVRKGMRRLRSGLEFWLKPLITI